MRSRPRDLQFRKAGAPQHRGVGRISVPAISRKQGRGLCFRSDRQPRSWPVSLVARRRTRPARRHGPAFRRARYCRRSRISGRRSSCSMPAMASPGADTVAIADDEEPAGDGLALLLVVQGGTTPPSAGSSCARAKSERRREDYAGCGVGWGTGSGTRTRPTAPVHQLALVGCESVFGRIEVSGWGTVTALRSCELSLCGAPDRT